MGVRVGRGVDGRGAAPGVGGVSPQYTLVCGRVEGPAVHHRAAVLACMGYALVRALDGPCDISRHASSRIRGSRGDCSGGTLPMTSSLRMSESCLPKRRQPSANRSPEFAVFPTPSRPATIAEMPQPVRRALVLSGGGMFGAWQVGAWSVLHRHARFHLIVVASIGSLNVWIIAASGA